MSKEPCLACGLQLLRSYHIREKRRLKRTVMQMSRDGLTYVIDIYKGVDGWTAECCPETGETLYYTRGTDRELVSLLQRLGFTLLFV